MPGTVRLQRLYRKDSVSSTVKVWAFGNHRGGMSSYFEGEESTVCPGSGGGASDSAFLRPRVRRKAEREKVEVEVERSHGSRTGLFRRTVLSLEKEDPVVVLSVGSGCVGGET